MNRPGLAVLAVLACSSGGVEHERLGDASFTQGDYVVALQEYRAAVDARPTADLWAKVGASALKTGDYREASGAYERLVTLDDARAAEAAHGLERVARAGEREADAAALRGAVEALRRLAPERVTSRQTLALVRSRELDPAEAAGLGPHAIAAAADAAGVDQMLVQYGEALQRTTACSEAIEVFQAALRRSRDRPLRLRSLDGLTSCGLSLGLEALTLEKPEVAVGWFALAVAADSTSPRGRRALVGLGDARVAQGDLLAATIAYQGALRPGADDSTIALAAGRLARLGAPDGAATTP